jgi:hypothetical protein
MKMLSEMNEAELATYTRSLARVIEGSLPPAPNPRGRCLFVVLFTETSGPGDCQYASTGTREDVIRWMRETADRLEQNQGWNQRTPFPPNRN